MLGDQQNMRAYVYCTFTCGCTAHHWVDELRTRSGKPVDVYDDFRHLVRCKVHDKPIQEPFGFVRGWSTGPGEGVQ